MDALDLKMDSLIKECWYRGNLRHLTRPGPQREAYDFIKGRDMAFSAFSPFVFNFHRRLGKTFLSTLLCIEACLKRPGIFAKFLGPSATQVQDILEEHWSIIMMQCPPDLEPDPFRGEKFTFRNPRWQHKGSYAKSILRLYGVNNDRGNKARGGSTDVGIFDECREMADLAYTWGSVLLPTFKGRHEPLALFISSPPDSMDHPYVQKFIAEAREKGRYRCVPASKDPTWTKEEDDLFAREMGGRDSPEYRREIQCELISDATSLIMPEFAQADSYLDTGTGVELQNEYVEAFTPEGRPPHYVAYTIADMGGAGKRTDRCGILFGFLDFLKGLVYIEDELFLRDLDTRAISLAWRHKAEELYDKEFERSQGREVVEIDWWAQTTEQQLVDFYRLFNLNARNVPTHDKEAARRYARMVFSTSKLRIHPRCEELQYQLRNGQRTISGDFQRSERLGHCDLVAALIALFRIVDWERNVIPKPRHDRETTFVLPERKGAGWDRYFKG
jgi:hypothetical protein